MLVKFLNFLILVLLLVGCKEAAKPTPPDWVSKIIKCNAVGWCKVETTNGKIGSVFKPLLGERICSSIKSKTIEALDVITTCRNF